MLVLLWPHTARSSDHGRCLNHPTACAAYVACVSPKPAAAWEESTPSSGGRSGRGRVVERWRNTRWNTRSWNLELEYVGIFIGHLSHKCHNYIYIYNYHNLRVVIYWKFPVESTDLEFTLFTLAFSISSKRGRIEVPCNPSRRGAKT